MAALFVRQEDIRNAEPFHQGGRQVNAFLDTEFPEPADAREEVRVYADTVIN